MTGENGLTVIRVSDGELELGVVPALGGRLLSLRHRGEELLWRNPALLDDALQPVGGHVPAPVAGTMADWHNYGGDKTWPAPQGWSSDAEWAGPPDPVLDSGPYTATVTTTADATVVELVSRPDPRTGLRLTRTLRLVGGGRVDVTLTAENTADREIEWALWNVTQLAGGGSVQVEVGPAFTAPVELAVGTAAPAWTVPTPGTVEIPAQDVVGKLGFPHATGRMVHRRAGHVLTWDFEVDDAADYPDGGSRAEVWLEYPLHAPLAHLGGLRPPDRIVECEVLGPLRRLAPGGSTSLHFRLTSSEEPTRG